jgi:hypothetical protein
MMFAGKQNQQQQEQNHMHNFYPAFFPKGH